MATLKDRFDVLIDVHAAKRRCGRTYRAQRDDFKRMKREAPSLGISDYFMFRLFDPEIWEREGGPRYFSGWRQHLPLNYALNPREACEPAWDKLAFEEIAQGAGIRTPKLQAVYLPPEGRKLNVDPPVLLRSLEDLRAFLTGQAEYPLFGKPSYCQQANLGGRIESYDKTTDIVRLTRFGEMSLAQYFRDYVTSTEFPEYYRPEYGFIFQSALIPHPDISALTGNESVSGCRITTVNTAEGPEIVAALQKMAKPNMSCDNFRFGRLGNLLAGTDPANGIADFALDRFGPRGRRIDSHPVTGHPIAGRQIPGWQELSNLVRKGARAVPDMHIHHWDIAYTAGGPTIIELNDLGLTTFLQSFGRGLFREPLRRALRQFGDIALYPWIAELPD